MVARERVEEIEIPVLEIAGEWTVDDLRTEDDCDDAYAYLVSAVASIEYQLDMYAIAPAEHQIGRNDPTWAPRARAALRMKRAALQVVQNTRGRLDRKRRAAEQDSLRQEFMDIVRDSDPARFRVWLDEAISTTQRRAKAGAALRAARGERGEG